MSNYGIITNDINVADSNFRRGTVHFFNAIVTDNDWNDVKFEGCYPSLPILKDDEYAIVTAMPFQYYGPNIMAPNSFMIKVNVYKDDITKQVSLSVRPPRGKNPTDNKNSEHIIILPAVFTRTGNDATAQFFKGSGVIENGIEKPTFFSIPNINSTFGHVYVRGYIVCMVYK